MPPTASLKTHEQQTPPPAKPMPLYERIKTHVIRGIASGTWKVGDKLPSEHELAAALGASRLTVHRAFRELAATGVLSRVHGVGTFVAPSPPISAIVRIHNIADEIRERGDAFSAEVYRLERTPAGGDLASRFEMKPNGELFHSLIVYASNGTPVQLEDRYVLPQFAPSFLSQDFASQSTTDYLQAIARATEAELVIEALMPDAQTCKLLRMVKSEPCLAVVRTTWVDRRVTTFTRFFHPGSRHRISSHLDARGPRL